MAMEPYVFVEGEIKGDSCEDLLGAVRLVLPSFAGGDGEQVDVVMLEGGITNQLYKLNVKQQSGTASSSSSSAANQGVIVRVYGAKTELFINRDWECNVFASLAKVGLAPTFHGRLGNCRVEGFIPNTAISPDDMGVGEVQWKIAEAMAALHAHTMPAGDADADTNVWQKLHRLFDVAEGVSFVDDAPDKQAIVDGLALSQAHAALSRMHDLVQEMTCSDLDKCGENDGNELFERGRAIAMETVLTHGDLLSGNLLLRNDDGRVVIIDYEYAAHNERAFDIANHFTEYAGFDFEIEEKYPDQEVRLRFLRRYLMASGKFNDILQAGDDDKALQQAGLGVDSILPPFVLLSHLFWLAWAVAQARYSSSDFDYLEYAVARRRGFDYHSTSFGIQFN